MTLDNAVNILSDYGKYMERSKISSFGFEDHLPYPKEEILLAVFTVIEHKSPIYSLDLLFMVVTDIMKHYPDPIKYKDLWEYQSSLESNLGTKK